MRRRNKFCLTLNSTPLHTNYVTRTIWGFSESNPGKPRITNATSSRQVRLAWYQGQLIKIYLPLLAFSWWDTCLDGLLFKGHKVIVPASLWKEMLNLIHFGIHLGILKCPICVFNSKMNPKEPLMENETRSRPWSITSAALFEFQGYSYLLCVDHFSKWPEFSKLKNQTRGGHFSISEKYLFT